VRPHVLVDHWEAISQETKKPELLKSEFARILSVTQEVVVDGPRMALAIRPAIGTWQYVSLTADELRYSEALTVSEYLSFKERVAGVDVAYVFFSRLRFAMRWRLW